MQMRQHLLQWRCPVRNFTWPLQILGQHPPMSALHTLLRPALPARRSTSCLTQLRRTFASEAKLPYNTQNHDSDDPFLHEITQASARPRPSSVAASRRESRSVFQGLQNILADAPSTSSTQSKEQLLSAVLDLDQYPSQRKLAEKVLRRQTFLALDSELDQVQEDLAGLMDDQELWQYASRKITRAQPEVVASEIYPQLVLLLFDRLPPRLQLSFFSFVSTVSPESFVYGCTPQLFARVMRLQWQHFSDIQAVYDTLNTMLDAGISLNHHIRDTIHEINFAIEADTQKATEEAVEALPHSSAGPPSFSQDEAHQESLTIRKEAFRRCRFSPEEQQAAEAMQGILAAEPIDAAVEVFEPLSFERSYGASKSDLDSESPQSASMAFDDWLRQTEELTQQQQQQAAAPSKARLTRPSPFANDQQFKGVYLHSRQH